jgi:glycosyltransferase involved in cell wall biosynthesis
MVTTSRPAADPADQREAAETAASLNAADARVSLLTGGSDRPYVFGLATAMIAQGVPLEVIGGEDNDGPEMHVTPGIKFLNLHAIKQSAGAAAKLSSIGICYAKLMRYAATAKPKIFHILWNNSNKFVYFDRTGLMLYYKLLGKKIVFTAHNVNVAKRDGYDSALNRLTLKAQYRLADHIFVHTERMKRELLDEYGVRDRAVTVIPFGINNSVPDTELSPREAKRRLGIAEDERTMLFFGVIRQYKGLDYLVRAFQKLAAAGGRYRLIIAGRAKKGAEPYLAEIQQAIARGPGQNQVIQRIEFVSDAEAELYFKGADVCVLPYTQIFQSGVLFLSYNFGLPVIATDVGSFEDDIVEGRNGFLCKACDAEDLAVVIERYFDSDLFQDLDRRRREIREDANARHSWSVVGARTREVYATLLGS